MGKFTLHVCTIRMFDDDRLPRSYYSHDRETFTGNAPC